jgi:hypothetical protein
MNIQQCEIELEEAQRELSVAEDNKRRNEYAFGKRDDWYGSRVSDCRARVSRAKSNLQSAIILERQRAERQAATVKAVKAVLS